MYAAVCVYDCVFVFVYPPFVFSFYTYSYFILGFSMGLKWMPGRGDDEQGPLGGFLEVSSWALLKLILFFQRVE